MRGGGEEMHPIGECVVRPSGEFQVRFVHQRSGLQSVSAPLTAQINSRAERAFRQHGFHQRLRVPISTTKFAEQQGDLSRFAFHVFPVQTIMPNIQPGQATIELVTARSQSITLEEKGFDHGSAFYTRARKKTE